MTARIANIARTSWNGAQQTALFVLCIGTGLAFPVAALTLAL